MLELPICISIPNLHFNSRLIYITQLLENPLGWDLKLHKPFSLNLLLPIPPQSSHHSKWQLQYGVFLFISSSHTQNLILQQITKYVHNAHIFHPSWCLILHSSPAMGYSPHTSKNGSLLLPPHTVRAYFSLTSSLHLNSPYREAILNNTIKMVFIFFFFLSNKPPLTQWLKKTYIYFLTVSMGQESYRNPIRSLSRL